MRREKTAFPFSSSIVGGICFHFRIVGFVFLLCSDLKCCLINTLMVSERLQLEIEVSDIQCLRRLESRKGLYPNMSYFMFTFRFVAVRSVQ